MSIRLAIMTSVVLGVVGTAPARAADLVRVPITVVPGSAAVDPTGGFAPGTPIALPYSGSFDTTSSSPSCSNSSGTVTLDVVDGAIEAEISGIADSNDTGRCEFDPVFSIEIELTVPDYDTSTTLVIVRPVDVDASFVTQPDEAFLRLIGFGGSQSTTLGPDVPLLPYLLTATYQESVGQPITPILEISDEAMIPGDTIRKGFRVETRLADNGSGPADGTLRIRFEFVAVRPTSLPEPGAGLSLPIGTLTLLGLASTRS